MAKGDPLGLAAMIDRAAASAHLCPYCGRPMTKAGWGNSGKNKRQLRWCKSCERRTMREKKA